MRILLLAASLGGLAAAGCGGLDCSFEACGGDPTGTWNMDGVCGDYSALEQQLRDVCPAIDVSVGADASGTLTFNTDGTFTQDLTITARGTIVVPASCFQDNPVTSCDDLEGDTLSCTGSPESSCRCQLSSSDTTGGGGTWMVNGTRITLDDGDPDDLDFCVNGDSMKARTVAGEDAQFVYVLSRMSE